MQATEQLVQFTKVMYGHWKCEGGKTSAIYHYILRTDLVKIREFRKLHANTVIDKMTEFQNTFGYILES